VVKRKYAGTRVGASLIYWAGARASREYAAESIRIDVWTTNLRLHDYYRRLGFTYLRHCADPSYPSAALFYMSTADIKETARSAFWAVPAISAAPQPQEGIGQEPRMDHHTLAFSPVHQPPYAPAAVTDGRSHATFRERVSSSRRRIRGTRRPANSVRLHRSRRGTPGYRHVGSVDLSVYRETAIQLIRTAAFTYSRLLSITGILR
jgi:hypothetical protein